jgi:hypothetical protein
MKRTRNYEQNYQRLLSYCSEFLHLVLCFLLVHRKRRGSFKCLYVLMYCFVISESVVIERAIVKSLLWDCDTYWQEIL